MSLRGRLLLLLVALILVGGAGGAVGGALVGARDRQNTLVRELTTARLRSEQLTASYADQTNSLTAYFVSNGTALLLQPYKDGVATSRRLVAQLHSDLQAAPGLRADLRRVQQAVESLRATAVTPALDLYQRGATADAIKKLVSRDVITASQTIRTDLNRLGTDIDRAIKQHTADRNSVNGWLEGLSFITLIALAICLLVAAVLIDRWTKRPIDAIAAAVRKVRSGALTTEVPAVGPPELAALGHDVDEMRARIIRELTQNVRAREALEQNAAVVLTLRRLLQPELTDIPIGWKIATGLRPAEGFVAGDSYDVALLPDGKLALVVIDVAGHGAVSAVSSLRCQELLGVALADGREPGDAISWLLEQIRDPGIELFFTAFVAVMDPGSGRCRYANAGHPAPLLTTEEGVVALGPTGPIVGPIPTVWGTAETVIAAGRSFAVYTDGLTDPRHVEAEEAPLDRLEDLLRDGTVQPGEIVERLLGSLELHNAGRLRDDVTLIVVCRDAADDAHRQRAPAEVAGT